MIPRRHLLGGGVVGGLLGVLGEADARAAGASAEPEAPQPSDESIQKIASAIADLRAELREQRQFSEIGPVRDAQKTFLRANSKFPDYIEVGVDVWMGVHDWHVRWQQPMTLGRDQSGRYTILLTQTVVIMRSDLLATYIGLPYDTR